MLLATVAVAQILAEAAQKRAALPSFHQEFERTTLTITPHKTLSFKKTLIVDGSRGRWRFRVGSYTFLYDGGNAYELDGDEYKVEKQPPTLVYDLSGLDVERATASDPRDCGLSVKQECTLIESPLNGGGTAKILLSLSSGLILARHTVRPEFIQTSHGPVTDTEDETYSVLKSAYGAQPEEALFTLPEGAKKVKRFKPWNGQLIAKRLKGEPVPAFAGRDINGNAINLADYNGKIVLLDFFTTWCPPCRADSPNIEKLYRKYGKDQLIVIGFSVNEDRKLVEKFLTEHPHPYPTVLTSENEMPRPFDVEEFPTYVIIGADGKVVSATSGEQGFSTIKGLLKKAGLDTD